MDVFVAMHKYNSKINFEQKHLINPRFLEQTESRRGEASNFQHEYIEQSSRIL